MCIRKEKEKKKRKKRSQTSRRRAEARKQQGLKSKISPKRNVQAKTLDKQA